MLERGHSDETYNARLDRNYADFKTRMERVGRGIHILYQGEDRELYWSTLEELRQARLPFLEEIKDPNIRECIKYLKSKEYVIIPPERVFDPTSIFGSSSEKNGTRKKKKKRSLRGRIRSLRPRRRR
tara:strand:+ start:23 stop:403 length:381 start_codon:yes stop_codon:yes gene_type:complete